jgi:hypothetical protein
LLGITDEVITMSSAPANIDAVSTSSSTTDTFHPLPRSRSTIGRSPVVAVAPATTTTSRPVSEGSVVEGDVVEGDVVEGDVVEGDVVEGDVVEGDVVPVG